MERTNQAAPIGPISVKSKETQHQSLQEFQKQANQSLQEVMVMEGGSNLLRLKSKVIIIT